MINKIIHGYEFLEFKDENFYGYFSTGKNNLNFNKNTDDGIKNLEKLKEWFNLKNIGYLNQIHSDIVHVYDGKICDGDAIITDRKNIGIGVFTADCVPVLVYDKNRKVIAAIHSGWKGTKKCIVGKTIDKMILKYNTKVEDLRVYIGPHNMECCYEVSEDLIRDFKKQQIYRDTNISQGRNLSLQKCIIKQLINKGVMLNNIIKLDICTYCNQTYSLYSYRKNKEYSGRMFSFIFMK